MKVKIKGSAWGKLKAIAGEWVEVDTAYLFRDQYNLAEPHNMRVFDRDIEAVEDDERDGLMTCKYCGFQAKSYEEMEAHFAAEEAKANKCEICGSYWSTITDTKRTTEKEHLVIDGKPVTIETCKTIYTWEQKCNRGGECKHLEHRGYGFDTFTRENTYFLKYPSGYGAWFDSLPTDEKWRELGFGYFEDGGSAIIKKSIPRTTYSISIFTFNGEIQDCDVYNSRRCFHLSKDDAIRAFNPRRNPRYSLRFDDNESRRKDPLEDLPKTAADDVYGFFRNQSERFYPLLGIEEA